MSLDHATWPVRTDRLLVRRATDADVDALCTIRSRPSVDEWLTRSAADRHDCTDHVRSRLDRLLAVERLDTPGTLIGELLVTVEDGWAQAEVADRAAGVQAELGWVVDPDHQGHGFATEAVRAALSICFDQLGLRRVVAHCFADNEPSWRLMERVGMRRETHTVRESLHRSGRWLDGLSYAILAEEWRAAQSA